MNGIEHVPYFLELWPQIHFHDGILHALSGIFQLRLQPVHNGLRDILAPKANGAFIQRLRLIGFDVGNDVVRWGDLHTRSEADIHAAFAFTESAGAGGAPGCYGNPVASRAGTDALPARNDIITGKPKLQLVPLCAELQRPSAEAIHIAGVAIIHYKIARIIGRSVFLLHLFLCNSIERLQINFDGDIDV